ncbi:MAG: VWA domain-containing protein [Acidobacteriaceae bacterium]
MRLGKLALTAALTLAATNHAQPPQAPTLQVYSRETVVDITVTDSKGNPVHGLTQSDFTIKEDGKPQSIRSFHEYAAQPTTPPPKLPPNVYTNLQPPPPTAAVNIFLLDFVNIAAMPALSVLGGDNAYAEAIASENAVKAEAKKYVATMPPGTRVIVLGLSKGLRVLQGSTSDPALLSAAIDTFPDDAEGRSATYEQYCAQAEQRTRMTLEALNQIAADVSGIKAKKNLLWFSVGIPWITDLSAHAQCLPDYSSDLLKTYGLFNAEQIAVYPIEARGLPMMPNAFITSTGRLWANIPNLPPPAYRAAQSDFRQTTIEQQLGMESWAEATGGAAFYNNNDLAGLIAKAVDKGANYYTISYVPPGQKYNWAHHSIKVEVDQPHLNLVYRESYDAVDPATIKPPPGLTLATLPTSGPIDIKTAMGRAMPTSTGILFDVEVTPNGDPRSPSDPTRTILGTLDPKLTSQPLTRYAFAYAVPARQIAFTTGPQGIHHGALELDIAVYDGSLTGSDQAGNAQLLTGLSQTIQMPLSDARYQTFIQGPFRFTQQLDLPPGPLFLRIGVLDPNAQKLGTLEIPLTVPKTPSGNH